MMMRRATTAALWTMALLMTRRSLAFVLKRHVFGSTAVPINMGASSYNNLRTRSSSSSSDNNDLDLLDPLIVCGPSGVGKGTIISKYMEDLGGSEHFGFTVSHTTRDPREGEEDGTHYHFTTHEDMQTLLKVEYFIESAVVHGNWYGTSWKSMRTVQSNDKRCLLDIDVQGVKRIKTLEEPNVLQPKYIFIAPPSMEVLEERLVGRGSESPETLQRRIGSARAEVDYGMAGNFDVIVTNDDLEQAVRDFEQAVNDLYDL